MALRIKAVGSGSAMPKLLASVNHPDDFSVPGWKVAKDWVAPCIPNEETGEGDVNFASVAAGYPVWDGSRLYTEQGSMSLQEFFELHNVPEGDQSYFRQQLDDAWEAAMNAEVNGQQPSAAYVNCRPWWNARCVCVRRGQPLRLKDGKTLHLRVRPSFYAVAIVIPPVSPSIKATIHYDFSEVEYHNRFVVFWERPTTVGTLDDGESAAEEVISYEEGTPWPGEDGRRGLVKISYKNPYDGPDALVAPPFEEWVLPAPNGEREDGRAFYGVPSKQTTKHVNGTFISIHERIPLHKIVDDFDDTPNEISASDIGATILPDFFLTQLSPGSSSLPAWRLGKYSVNGKMTYVSLGYATAPGMTNHREKTFTNGNGTFTAIEPYYSTQRLVAALNLKNPDADIRTWPLLVGDAAGSDPYYAGYAYYKDADGQQKIAYYDPTYDTNFDYAYLPWCCYAYVRENTNGPVWEEIEIEITSGRGAGGGATPSEGYETAYVDIPGDWSDGEISGNLDGNAFENPSWVQREHKTSYQGADYTQLKITPPFVKQDGGWAPNQKCTFKVRRPRYTSFGVIDSVSASFWMSAGEDISVNSDYPPSPGSFSFEPFPVG